MGLRISKKVKQFTRSHFYELGWVIERFQFLNMFFVHEINLFLCFYESFHTLFTDLTSLFCFFLDRSRLRSWLLFSLSWFFRWRCRNRPFLRCLLFLFLFWELDVYIVFVCIDTDCFHPCIETNTCFSFTGKCITIEVRSLLF